MSERCRIAILGAAPIGLVGKVCEAYANAYPGAVALDSGHPLSRECGATIMLVGKDDPELETKQQGADQ